MSDIDSRQAGANSGASGRLCKEPRGAVIWLYDWGAVR